MSAIRTRRGLVTAAATAAFACASLLVPAAALAHATLESVAPARADVLARSPGQVVFAFDEPVTATAGGVRVFGPGGREVQQGAPLRPAGKPRQVGAHVPGELPRGTYTATYRVVSADGHVVSGGTTFSVGAPSATSATVGQLIDRQDGGPITRTALTIARGVQYAAIAVGIGVLLFLLGVWRTALARTAGAEESWDRAAAAFSRRVRRVVLWAAVAGVVSAALAVGLDAANAAGEGLFSITGNGALGDTLGARFGRMWVLGACAWVALGAGAALLLPARSPAARLRPATLGATGQALATPRPAALAALVIPAAFLVLLPGLGGHAGSLPRSWLLIPANALHVLASCAWIGGVTALLLAVRSATAELGERDRTRLLVAATTGFSALALIAVVVLAASGVLQAIGTLGSVADLWDTGYGRLILVKAALLVVIAALGALQRRRSIPALEQAERDGASPGAGGVRLRSVLRVEALVIVAVLAATAVLSGSAPSGAVAGPVVRESKVAGADLQLTVDPAATGANEIHLYLLDDRTGAAWDRAKEVTITATQARRRIGPLRAQVIAAGPGHYVARGLVLPATGTWTLSVTVRTSAFDEDVARLQVPVR